VFNPFAGLNLVFTAYRFAFVFTLFATAKPVCLMCKVTAVQAAPHLGKLANHQFQHGGIYVSQSTSRSSHSGIQG
jgi:hypothetical protein